VLFVSFVVKALLVSGRSRPQDLQLGAAGRICIYLLGWCLAFLTFSDAGCLKLAGVANDDPCKLVPGLAPATDFGLEAAPK